MSNTPILKIFAVLGAILFPLMLLSAFFPTPPKTVYLDRVVTQIQVQYLNMNVVLHGNSINTVVAYMRDNKPDEYKKILWFYNIKVKNPSITQIIIDKALKYEVPLHVAFAMAFQESGFNPTQATLNKATATRPASWDLGLFQANTVSHPKWKKADFFNPEKNADDAMKVYSERMAKHDSLVLDLALVDYNAGNNSLKNGKIPFTTSLHVFSVRAYERQLDLEFCKTLVPMLDVNGLDLSKLD